MLRKLLAALGLIAAPTSDTGTVPPYAPYPNGATNEIYNLLFCDDPAAFRPRPGASSAAWQVALVSEPPDRSALQALVADTAQEGRVRYLACTRLRQLGQPVPNKVLLGVVVEMPLAGGLDVLAAFSEGGVRYLNQSGKLGVVEGVESLQGLVRDLLTASKAVVARIGPWDQPRRPPPAFGNVRLTFLVSDGLYFGEGPASAMEREPMAGPVIQRAAQLLQAVVAMGTE
jgi:hypothetical protein